MKHPEAPARLKCFYIAVLKVIPGCKIHCPSLLALILNSIEPSGADCSR